jgi:thiol-disulfide isomerase/thioredoxin
MALTSRAQTAIPEWKIGDLDHYLKISKKPVVLSLWATFCRPCVAEIPYFQSTIASYGQGKIDFLLVSLDLAEFYPKKIAAFAKEHGFNATIAWLNETDANVFGPHIDPKWTGAIPSSVFLNPATGYRKFYEGELTPDQFNQALKDMLQP